jgi:hypothetical protein
MEVRNAERFTGLWASRRVADLRTSKAITAEIAFHRKHELGKTKPADKETKRCRGRTEATCFRHALKATGGVV